MRDHLLLPPTPSGIAEAASLLKKGELVAFPTETVYGLGASALDSQAVLSIFAAKGRPLTDPLIVHVSSLSMALQYVDLNEQVSSSHSEKEIFHLLGDRFWPGPLTIISKASPLIPLLVTANTGFVGLRIPLHPLASSLITAAGLPIAAPSANRFGHVSPTRSSHVLDDLGEKGVRVLDGEGERVGDEKVFSCEFGIESTVIKLEPLLRQVSIFRQGGISQQQLEDFLREKDIDWSVKTVVRTVKMHHTDVETEKKASNEALSPPSVTSDSNTNTNEIGQVAPGQAVTHYAPDLPCYMLSKLSQNSEVIYSSENNEMVLANSDMKKFHLSVEQLKSGVILIDFHQQLAYLKDFVHAYYDLSTNGSTSEAAYQLFHVLRWTEQFKEASLVLIATITKTSQLIEREIDEPTDHKPDITLGVVDRIFRATSGIYAEVSME